MMSTEILVQRAKRLDGKMDLDVENIGHKGEYSAQTLKNFRAMEIRLKGQRTSIIVYDREYIGGRPKIISHEFSYVSAPRQARSLALSYNVVRQNVKVVDETKNT